MAVTLSSLADLGALPFDSIIDVRSPAEYVEDHVPGAISLPVLDNEERAQVGTIYKQESPFTARKLGAALVARNAARHLQGPLADKDGGWRPLVYCWRGGQRSGSFSVILAQVGWRSDVVQGGYKAYRKLVVQAMHEAPLPHRLVLIDGLTGTGKTDLLALLAETGAQVVDLEGIGRHRGSLFGGMPGGQPAQKMFESRLAMAFGALDPARPVFVEAESAKVGDLLVPPSVWKAMQAAPRIELAAPVAARAAYTVTAYDDIVADRAALGAVLDQLRPYQPRELIARWHGLAQAGEMQALAAELMAQHYDPRYIRAQGKVGARIGVVEMADVSPASLRGAVPRVLELGTGVSDR
ncbi:tRNA 2-selenouridine(34) synthase MnmH [Mesobacterium pallidum]|uniref:tRNA 2-selenouridine(34) synthase MnmH n=1 Tax=Mesobacterium pallidum TaxID=2872037 RepID=UPI001EE1C060|nr:tRNA 2-selenouridine(34) synthase MnmH [Mesobacterium pallidum]